MFSQVVATGQDSWAPSIGSLPPDVGRIQLEYDDVADNMENNQSGPKNIGGASTPPGNASSSASKRRKIGKNKGMIFSLMSDLHQSILAVKPPPVITVKEVVKLISSSPELRANLNLYYFALEHIRDKTTREIFMSIAEDSFQKLFLQTAKNRNRFSKRISAQNTQTLCSFSKLFPSDLF
ncbi:hypothetical protein KSP40_PGU003343 [Platanthera guangdongensis]|uniref:Uncharacterized protein n=1 Tax=Platanthera guangdongensis TaxID=2320717 RepID=A0ABR2MXX4_9ASPA